MVRCALCIAKVGDGPKYRKHLISLRHKSNQAKKADPNWVDLRSSSIGPRKLEALGLGKNRWITAEQHAQVMTLKRIAGTGIPEDCFILTGATTIMGFCTEAERVQAKELLDSRTISIAQTKLERARFQALGVRGTMCSQDEFERARVLTRRRDAGLSHDAFAKEVHAEWCSPDELKAARAKWLKTCDWLPDGANCPKDEVVFPAKKNRPISGRRLEVTIAPTPTLGGTLPYHETPRSGRASSRASMTAGE